MVRVADIECDSLKLPWDIRVINVEHGEADGMLEMNELGRLMMDHPEVELDGAGVRHIDDTEALVLAIVFWVPRMVGRRVVGHAHNEVHRFMLVVENLAVPHEFLSVIRSSSAEVVRDELRLNAIVVGMARLPADLFTRMMMS